MDILLNASEIRDRKVQEEAAAARPAPASVPEETAAAAAATESTRRHPQDEAVDKDRFADAVLEFIVDAYIGTCVDEDFPGILMDLVLQQQEMQVNMGKSLVLGTGRAGKTATMMAMLGKAFEHTESTVGINNDYTVKITSETAVVSGDEDGGDRWTLAEKAEKQYENVLAEIAVAIKQGKLSAAVSTAKKAALAMVDGPSGQQQQQPQKTNKQHEAEDQRGSGGDKEGDDGRQTVRGADRPSRGDDDASALTAEGRPSDDGSRLFTPLAAPTDEALDGEYFMKTMAEKLMVNAKFSIAFFDFGGQEVFNVIHPFFLTSHGVYNVVFNMEEWLDPSRRRECERDIKLWVNSVVVYTMKEAPDEADLSRPAPLFIVGTHKDTVPRVEDHREMSTAIETIFGKHHPMWRSLCDNDLQSFHFFPMSAGSALPVTPNTRPV